MSDEALFHPVANIFPLMGEAELDALAEDIRANGLREPVWLHRDGRIVDGRNRWLAWRDPRGPGDEWRDRHHRWLDRLRRHCGHDRRGRGHGVGDGLRHLRQHHGL